MTNDVGDEVIIEPIAIDLPLAKLSLTFEGFQIVDPSDLGKVEGIVEILQERLVDAQRTKSWFQSGDTVYSLEYGQIKVELNSVKPGSIIAATSIVVGVIVTIYQGIASYPSFKVGYRALQDDVAGIIKEFMLMLNKRSKRQTFLIEEDDKSVLGEIAPVSAEEVFAILEDEVNSNQ